MQQALGDFISLKLSFGQDLFMIADLAFIGIGDHVKVINKID